MKQPSFGRRTPPASISQPIAAPVLDRGERQPERVDPDGPSNTDFKYVQDRSLDDELLEWKKARRRNHRLPWRQIYLMASVCFGIGYFVLPASVNHVVEWLLLALGILSVVSGIASRAKPLADSKSR